MAGQYLEGCTVVGHYMGHIEVKGVVRLSRVKLGGKMVHHVDLMEPVTVFGAQRQGLVLQDEHVLEVLEAAA